jgi:4-hydroxybenzoate polyprenyltransferase
MIRALKIYERINLLSIDVALGAVCSSLFLSSIIHEKISYPALAVLGLSVWVIYTTDRLLDVVELSRAGKACHTRRHQFHKRHFSRLIGVLCLATLILLVLLLAIPKQVLFRGVALSFIVLLYLLFNKKLKSAKELFISVGYCAGVLLPTGIDIDTLFVGDNFFILLSFFITVLFNSILFSWLDIRTDTQEGKHSFVTHMGSRATKRFLLILFSVQAALCLFIAINFWPAALLLFSMNGVMLLVILGEERINLPTQRMIGEAVFLMPGLYWSLYNW